MDAKHRLTLHVTRADDGAMLLPGMMDPIMASPVVDQDAVAITFNWALQGSRVGTMARIGMTRSIARALRDDLIAALRILGDDDPPRSPPNA